MIVRPESLERTKPVPETVSRVWARSRGRVETESRPSRDRVETESRPCRVSRPRRELRSKTRVVVELVLARDYASCGYDAPRPGPTFSHAGRSARLA
uniref:Uncharacterized protein n=1 Tax=Vespula pensylvanica TaxID=30213 RepID=A0A834NX69_VESPE|nr:hypothetical protein H0235_010510 [Vespula pensylvanica]